MLDSKYSTAVAFLCAAMACGYSSLGINTDSGIDGATNYSQLNDNDQKALALKQQMAKLVTHGEPDVAKVSSLIESAFGSFEYSQGDKVSVLVGEASMHYYDGDYSNANRLLRQASDAVNEKVVVDRYCTRLFFRYSAYISALVSGISALMQALQVKKLHLGIPKLVRQEA